MLLRHLFTASYYSGVNIGQQTTSKAVRVVIISAVLSFLLYFFARQQRFTIQSISLHVWHTTNQKIKRPSHINRDHGLCGHCPEDKQTSDAWELTELVTHISPTTSFLLNIGAASAGGGQYDPTYPLLNASNSPFAALLIDPSTNPEFLSAYPNRSNIQIIHNFTWPETIISSILEKYNVPKDLTILKIDVDSYECSLLETILRANYRPQFIHTEFNPIFPPPIIFIPIYNATTKNDWKPSLWLSGGPFYGCSLSALTKILSLFDYVLVDVEFWDVIYIQRHLAQSHHIQVPANDHVAYEHGFLSHSCFPYCQTNSKLYNEEVKKASAVILDGSDFITHMKTIVDRFAPISTKTNLTHPYILSV